MQAADRVTVDLAADRVAGGVAEAVTTALADGRALRLAYVSATGEPSDRTVDPMRVLALDGHSYLEAWCRQAGAVRTFRLDRIESVVVLDEAADVPRDAAPVDLGAGILRPEGAPVTLDLDPEVAWIAEEHPVDAVTDLGGGRLRVVLPVADERWLVALLLRSGPAVRVVDRPDLAERARASARAALAAYGVTGS
jgi:proteasome accessory factor C